jgi:predicted ferric reductase
MDEVVARAPMLGMPELTIGIFALLFLLWLGVTRQLSTPLRFLFLLMLLRYVLNFLHVYTIVPIAAGQSINALSTILFMVAGVWALGPRIFQLKYLAVFYIFTALQTRSMSAWSTPLSGRCCSSRSSSPYFCCRTTTASTLPS